MNAMWYFAFVTPLNYRQPAVTENLDYYSSIGIYHDQPQESSVVYSTDFTAIYLCPEEGFHYTVVDDVGELICQNFGVVQWILVR